MTTRRPQTYILTPDEIGKILAMKIDILPIGSKRMRKSNFNAVKRALTAIDILESGVEIQAIGTGCNRNGDPVIIITAVKDEE